MSVVNFPAPKKTLEDNLNKRMEELDDLYDTLNDVHTKINNLEYETHIAEQEYNKILAKYAKIVGVENIPVGFLQYSTEARIYLGENGSYEVSFEHEDEEEPVEE